MSAKKKNPGDMLDLKKDQVMTAVVMADSFDKKFRPISEDVPRVIIMLYRKFP